MNKKGNYQETGTITNVTESEDGYYISRSGMGCFLGKNHGVIPKEGDLLTVHTKGSYFGTIRGMDLNGKQIFWKTDKDLETEKLDWLREYEEEKQQRYKDGVLKMDEQYSALPKCFQERIDKFRANNKRFRIDYESYELFCCEQAIFIANGCKTPEEIKKFADKNWNEQLKQVPELSEDHSGNTFGTACHLAYWYLSNPENVVKIQGALTPLVGSKEYGDVAGI